MSKIKLDLSFGALHSRIMKLWTLAFQLHEKTLYIAPHGDHTLDPKKALKFQTKASAEQALEELDEFINFVPWLEDFEDLDAEKRF